MWSRLTPLPPQMDCPLFLLLVVVLLVQVIFIKSFSSNNLMNNLKFHEQVEEFGGADLNKDPDCYCVYFHLMSFGGLV